jgi:hypothetical protein
MKSLLNLSLGNQIIYAYPDPNSLSFRVFDEITVLMEIGELMNKIF